MFTFSQDAEQGLLSMLTEPDNSRTSMSDVSDSNGQTNEQPPIVVPAPVKLSQFKCNDCGYITRRKNNLTVHLAEHCKIRRRNGQLAAKDIECRFCFTKMTYNTLRRHLKHYITMLTTNKTLTQPHAKFTLTNHQNYLADIKLEKQNKM